MKRVVSECKLAGIMLISVYLAGGHQNIYMCCHSPMPLTPCLSEAGGLKNINNRSDMLICIANAPS
jgi:hypothetical protein